MNNIENLQKIGLIFGPIQLIVYIWIVYNVLHATKKSEDNTARKRWIKSVLLNGGLCGILVVAMTVGSVISHTNEQISNIFQLIYAVLKDFFSLVCIFTPAALIGTLITFSNIAPWFRGK